MRIVIVLMRCRISIDLLKVGLEKKSVHGELPLTSVEHSTLTLMMKFFTIKIF
jgi:hypothetical protein